ncbi:uncharacterized protein LOC115673448 [Syzygium oleosum]|uniref:uncharacterized protein LOC115673448 n=1 Tax=Syzygium oleosum TaxID=219896 RepID=UPI0011D1813D|nr:uncharacterized protein LOC115673448 [Syzygium oleosum]
MAEDIGSSVGADMSEVAEVGSPDGPASSEKKTTVERKIHKLMVVQDLPGINPLKDWCMDNGIGIVHHIVFWRFFSVFCSTKLKYHLQSVYADAAQYNDPIKRPVEAICNAIDGASPRNDTLRKIFAGLVASDGNLTCYVNPPSPGPSQPSPGPSQTDLGWDWQLTHAKKHREDPPLHIHALACAITRHPNMFSSHYSLLIILILFSACVATGKNLDGYYIPKLSGLRRTFIQDPTRAMQASILSKDFQTFFYNQTLDHFNYRPESYTLFKQRYVINFKYWDGANTSTPIFVYLGAELPIDDDMGDGRGFLTDNAAQFRALLVYIEHRFYGESIPYGLTLDKALNDPNTRGYFSSAQALADYAEIIVYLKQKLNAKHSPVIVIGGSYGGVLASWFRLKYPHVALGALASSAPILYFYDLTPHDPYASVVAKDFLEASFSCLQTIRQSWDEIDRVASEPHGLTKLSKTFKTCSPLQSSSELKNHLVGIYAGAAQYNDPFRRPVEAICNSIDGASPKNDILKKIFAGLVASNGNLTCYVNPPSPPPSQTDLGWHWQTCSEMVARYDIINNTMFQSFPFDLNEFVNDCKRRFGVAPRPHWATTYYGGHDIKLVLHRFASNIIFSNGLQDPYSSGGVLKNISDTVIAVYTAKGSHCLDILATTEKDPIWLVKQRKNEVEIIRKWIATYYADLRAFGK